MNKIKKPFIQKAYEKWAMQLLSIISRFCRYSKLPKFDGEMAIMLGTDEYGKEHLYQVILGKNDSIIPISQILTEDDAKAIDPNFDSMDKHTREFYSAFVKDERRKIKDFDNSLVMSEFEDYR